MRQWLAKFMYGRYGSDQFGKFLSIVSLVLLVAGMILQNTVGTIGTLLIVVAAIILVYCYYRMLSRKTNDRYRENVKFLDFKYKITGWFRQRKDRWKQRSAYRFFKCPACGVTVRVPRGKGKVRITCPKCGNSFIKNT